MDSRPFSVLLVSGDQALLRQLTRFLELFGYEIRQAIDADQALAAAEVAGADFLLVDGSLTTKPDLAFLRKIRSFARGSFAGGLLISVILSGTEFTANCI